MENLNCSSKKKLGQEHDTNCRSVAPPPFTIVGVNKNQSIDLGQYIQMVSKAEARLHYRLMKNIIYRLAIFVNYCQQNNLYFDLLITKIYIFNWDEIFFKFRQTKIQPDYFNQLLQIIKYILKFEYSNEFEFSEQSLNELLVSASNFYGPQFCNLLRFLYLNQNDPSINIIDADEYIEYINTQNQHNEVHYYFIEELFKMQSLDKYVIRSDPKSIDKPRLRTLIKDRKYYKPNPEYIQRILQDHRCSTYQRYTKANQYLKSQIIKLLNNSFSCQSECLSPYYWRGGEMRKQLRFMGERIFVSGKGNFLSIEQIISSVGEHEQMVIDDDEDFWSD